MGSIALVGGSIVSLHRS